MTRPIVTIAPLLTFFGQAEEAMNFYTSLFDNSQIVQVTRFGSDGPGKEGSVMHATFTLNGRTYMCIDSIASHEWSFTPAISLYINVEREEDIVRLYERLVQDGDVYMPLGDYGFSRRFAWIADRFGVSWQLNLV